jgi:hypothetical protein
MHCAEAASIVLLLLLYPPTTSTTTTTPGEISTWNTGKMVHHRSSSEFMQNRSACHPPRLRVRMWCEIPQNADDSGFLGNLVALADGEVRWGEVVCGRTWRSQSFSPSTRRHGERAAGRETSTKTRYQLAVSSQSVAFHRLKLHFRSSFCFG